MSPLYVCAADYLNRLYNLVGFLLKALLNFLRDSEHRCRAEGITCMNTYRVDVLDEAHGNHVVLRIADNLQLQLLPAEDGFLNQNLSYHTCLKSSGADCL